MTWFEPLDPAMPKASGYHGVSGTMGASMSHPCWAWSQCLTHKIREHNKYRCFESSGWFVTRQS